MSCWAISRGRGAARACRRAGWRRRGEFVQAHAGALVVDGRRPPCQPERRRARQGYRGLFGRSVGEDAPRRCLRAAARLLSGSGRAARRDRRPVRRFRSGAFQPGLQGGHGERPEPIGDAMQLSARRYKSASACNPPRRIFAKPDPCASPAFRSLSPAAAICAAAGAAACSFRSACRLSHAQAVARGCLCQSRLVRRAGRGRRSCRARQTHGPRAPQRRDGGGGAAGVECLHRGLPRRPSRPARAGRA